MNKFVTILIALMVVLMFVPLVSAVQTLEQQGGNGLGANTPLRFNSAYAYVSYNVTAGKTFYLTFMNISATKLGTPSGPMWIEIYPQTASGPTINTSRLAKSNNVDVSTFSTSGSFVTFVFNTSLQLNSGSSYAIVLAGDYALSTVNNIRINESSNTTSTARISSGTGTWTVDSASRQLVYQMWSNTTNVTNVTTTTYNFYTNSSINSFCVTNLSLYWCTTNGTATLEGLLTNETALQTLRYESNESGGYFNVTYTNVNVSSNVSTAINKAMAQNEYTFYAVEKITGNNLTGFNFTSVRGSTTYLTNVTHYMSNGTYEITASKSGYYNKTAPITATTLQTVAQNISYVGNHTLNITARDLFTNALINTFNVRVISTTYGYDETYSTTNGIILDNTTSVTLTYEAYATGYFNKTGTLTLTGNASNNTIVLTPFGGLQVVFIRSTNGSIITSPTQTVIFQNETTSTSYTGINGTSNVTGLIEDTYRILCQVTGFDNNTYTYDYPALTDTPPSTFYCVMSQSTSQITFQIQSPDLTPLANVLIEVEQFVNGSYRSVASEYTDGTGQSVMNLVQGLTTRITLTLAGYTTQVNVNSLDATTYTYTLDPVNRFDPSNSAGSSITYSFYPTQFDLNLSVWDFTLNVTPDSGTLLEYFKITIANVNGTILNQINATVSSGGQIILPFNTTPYNGSVLRVTYAFKKTDNTEYSVLIVYNIADRYVTGSIIGARNYILANFDLGERIFLWMFLTVVSAIILSALGIKDLLNVFLTSLIWLGLGYVFALNMIILGFVFFVIMIVITRYTL